MLDPNLSRMFVHVMLYMALIELLSGACTSTCFSLNTRTMGFLRAWSLSLSLFLSLSLSLSLSYMYTYMLINAYANAQYLTGAVHN